MANPVFDRGMHQIIPAVMGCIGWKDEMEAKEKADRIFVPHRLTSTQRCGDHLLVHILREDSDGTRTPVNPPPDFETSAQIMGGLALAWSQNGGENMGLPWGSLDFVFRADGKIAMDFAAEQTDEEDDYVKTIHDEREKLYEELFCENFPKLIMKLKHLFGVWGMGGLVDFVVTNPKLGQYVNYHVHSSFGLSNPDMPSWIVPTETNSTQPGASSYILSPKEQRPLSRVGMSGYGYELLIITKKQEDWCKYLMQWAVNMEILKDVNFLANVEVADGITSENVPLGETRMGNVLIAPAQDPWPQSGMLSSGIVKFFIMTVITTEEMKFAIKEGRIALLKQLQEKEIGQVSELDRI